MGLITIKFQLFFLIALYLFNKNACYDINNIIYVFVFTQ